MITGIRDARHDGDPLYRILAIDTDTRRHIDFIRRWRQHNLVSVGNFAEATHALVNGSPYDLVSMDADLGSDATGADVAQFIVTRIPRSKRPRNVIIHATDSRRARVMYQILTAAGIPTKHVPFTGSTGEGGWS